MPAGLVLVLCVAVIVLLLLFLFFLPLLLFLISFFNRVYSSFSSISASPFVPLSKYVLLSAFLLSFSLFQSFFPFPPLHWAIIPLLPSFIAIPVLFTLPFSSSLVPLSLIFSSPYLRLIASSFFPLL